MQTKILNKLTIYQQLYEFVLSIAKLSPFDYSFDDFIEEYDEFLDDELMEQPFVKITEAIQIDFVQNVF